MKALIYRSFGPPEVLEWVDGWPIPSPGAGQILVRVAAGSVNPKDILLRKGKFRPFPAWDRLPRVVGLDAAGVVETLGRGVQDLAVGDPVWGMTNRFCGGVLGELALFSSAEVSRMPSGLSMEEAAAVPLAAQTALQSLRDLGCLVGGQKVLIIGASGGVGHFAVQIGKRLGAQVHAVCGPKHQHFVRDLGADEAVDYSVCPIPELSRPPGGFHCIFDAFGKHHRRAVAHLLAPEGIFVSTVPKLATLKGELLARLGFGRRDRLVGVRSRREDLELLAQWTEEGSLRPHLDAVYAIQEAAAAHRHVEGKHTTGKVVLALEETSSVPS